MCTTHVPLVMWGQGGTAMTKDSQVEGSCIHCGETVQAGALDFVTGLQLQWHSLAAMVSVVSSFVGTRQAASMSHLSILISTIRKKAMKKFKSRKGKSNC